MTSARQIGPAGGIWLTAAALAGVLWALGPLRPASGQELPAAAADGDLAVDQAGLADRFHRLEQVALRLAELTALTNPRRAALLQEMIGKSKELDIQRRLDAIVKLLEADRLGAAGQEQTTVEEQLQLVLQLLLKENRQDRLDSEKQRMRRYLKMLDRLIKQQLGVKARTESDEEGRRLAELQSQLADKTGQLARTIESDEQIRDRQESEPQRDEARAAESQTKDVGSADRDPSNPSDAGPPDPPKGAGGSKPSPGAPPSNPSDGSNPPDGQSPGSQGESQDQSGSPKDGGSSQPQDNGSQPQNNGGSPPDEPANKIGRAHENIRRAQQQMREAREHLEQDQRDPARTEQQQALNRLHEARAELQRILRQLREEEVHEMLAMLETRFRRMLQWQLQVQSGTVKLATVPAEQRGHDQEIAAGRWGRRELLIVREADRALAVMRAEGSSAAFPEAVELTRDDMQQVATRLVELQVGDITQQLEKDIIQALEEMIQALEKARRDLEKNNRKPPGAPAAGPTEPGLVDLLAELKMIRSLQMRINTRTETYRTLLEASADNAAEVHRALDRLADRQRRVHEATRALQTGGAD